MTFSRTPISAPKNLFFDAENVDDISLTLEQSYNEQIESGIINNHFGSGVLPDNLIPNILFDSNTTNVLLDGQAISVSNQPSDPNNGNQLEITLTNSAAAGNRTVKLLVIGLDFQNNLQYDRFVFDKNETQTSSNHFTVILTILFNDFIGIASQSLNLGGRVVIKEAKSFSLSRDCIMASQDLQPNLFFRDFFVSNNGTLANVLSAALPSYNINALNIMSGYKQLRSIVENDVSSQIGQKFLATTNNIQKITLLLSVINNTTPSNLDWTGDIIVSIYPLQSVVACSSDITPQLAIDFDPANIPLAQLSLNYDSLLASGIQLNTVPQPVDFIFSNTLVASGSTIIPGNYYAVTLKRAGSADTCQIQLATGVNTSTTSWDTLFNGTVWTDVPEESLWFQVWTDSAKVSDGQAYDNGNGMVIPKTIINPTTGATQDYSLNDIQFVGNALYYALAQATTTQLALVQNDRTGDEVYSEQQYTPSITLLNTLSLSNIQNVSNPLIIGTISDQNIKSYSSTNATLTAAFHEYGMVKNKIVIKVITDTTDGYRYDQNIINLQSQLVGGYLNGAKFIPDVSNPSFFYRIAKAEIVSMMYGDVDGNGVIDNNDLLLAQTLIGSNLNVMPSYNQYIQQTTYFQANSNQNWQIINPSNSVVIAAGSDGILVPNPNNVELANFNSISANFNSIVNLGTYNLVITGSSSVGNNGTFTITSLIDNNDITIQKIYYTSDTILEIMRGDISGDMILDATDISYLENYINATPPFPPTTSPENKIGTTFQVMVFTLEEYVDRNDDYTTSTNRSTVLHPLPDPYLDGYSYFANDNLEFNPITFNVVKQLNWEQSSVVVSPNYRQVPCTFTYQTGYDPNQCKVPGIVRTSYPTASAFDPGRNDFFIPNNLIVDYSGQFVRPDGYLMKMDFEISTILIEIPDVPFDMEHSINLLSDFVADSGNGFTIAGYPAMRFSDCSTVGLNALANNQIRFAVAVQSFSPQLNGIDPNCIDGIIVDGKIGVSINYSTGILTLNFTNLYQDPVEQTLNTKVEITTYIKKAGWNNIPIYINSTKAQNMLGVPTPVVPNTNC